MSFQNHSNKNPTEVIMDHKLIQDLNSAIEGAVSEALKQHDIPYGSFEWRLTPVGGEKVGAICAISGTTNIPRPAGSGGSSKHGITNC